MDLVEATRCVLFTWTLLIIVSQMECESRCEHGSSNSKLGLNTTTLRKLFHSHRTLFLTALGTLSVMLLGCLGCLCCCCCCRRSTQKQVRSLDAFAPRTQSIVWPSIPEETAHVLEVTFLHTPDARSCLCRACVQARNSLCIDICMDTTEC